MNTKEARGLNEAETQGETGHGDDENIGGDATTTESMSHSQTRRNSNHSSAAGTADESPSVAIAAASHGGAMIGRAADSGVVSQLSSAADGTSDGVDSGVVGRQDDNDAESDQEILTDHLMDVARKAGDGKYLSELIDYNQSTNDNRSVMTLDEERVHTTREWELCLTDPYRASPDSKYHRYDVTVDHRSGDRATEIILWSHQRPHMRSLHCAWISFFLACTVWFAPSPLLKEIQTTLGLSKKEVWTSSIMNDVTAVFMRTFMGPICDAYGARIPMSIVLLASSIPAAMLGLVKDATGLAVIRMFIGVAGSSFVMAQFWPSRMFSREIAGTANGVVGGWGNLGGACAQLLMGGILFPLVRDLYGGDGEKSWRTICIVPAFMTFIWGLILPWISDDAPMGNYGEMKKNGSMDAVYMTTSLRSGVTANTWILFAQYASSLGVEIVMNNAAVLYFSSEFGLGTEDASIIGFVYGSMNIFARALGGLISDRLNLRMGMRGRLWLQTILLFMEGLVIIVFAFADSIMGAVVDMCIFSIFTQAAEGAIYGVVPHVSKLYTGSVAGFVGSGGSAGSVVYGLGFRTMPYRQAFVMMGSIVMCSSFLTLFINIPCHAGLIWGEDNNAVIGARERYKRRKEMERRILSAQGSHSNSNTNNNIDVYANNNTNTGEGRDDKAAKDGAAARNDPAEEKDGADPSYVDEVLSKTRLGGTENRRIIGDEEKQVGVNIN